MKVCICGNYRKVEIFAVLGRQGKYSSIPGGDKRLFSSASLLFQCFSTAGPRPGTGPWYQLYRAARGCPGICHFIFL